MSVDLQERRDALDGAKRRFRSRPGSGGALGASSADIDESWRRCGRLVEVDRVAPVDLSDPSDAWAASPISRAATASVDELAALARAEDYIAAITNADGRIIWASAAPGMLRMAESANFVRGSNWSEAAAGTNAPGLVLRTGRPAAVFSAEHWCDTVTDWVCYAAPVRDPAGRIVGAVDLSAGWRRAHPLALTTISAIARLIEHEIADSAALDAPELTIDVLGHPRVVLHGRRLALTNRQVEILTLLALNEAMTVSQLQTALSGERELSPSTVKAEVSRLRSTLGDGISSRPYRLRYRVELDVARALSALRRNDLETALRSYRGPLLPASSSSAIAEVRNQVEATLGGGLLRSGTADQLLRFAERQPFGAPFVDRAVELGHDVPR